MKHCRNICLSLFLFFSCLFANGQEVSPFPFPEFFTSSSDRSNHQTKIYYPSGQIKAEGLSLKDYNQIEYYKEYESLSGRHRIWKEYYENGNIKFAFKYPPKGRYNKGLLGLNLIHFGRGRYSDDIRYFGIAFFYREDGTLICKGGLELDPDFPMVYKLDLWMYYNQEGILTRQEYYYDYPGGLDTAKVSEVFIDDSVEVPSYFPSIFDDGSGLNPGSILHRTTDFSWRRTFNSEGNTITYSVNPNLFVEFLPNGKLSYIRFYRPSSFGISEKAKDEVNCLTAKSPSFKYYEGTAYHRYEFGQCGLCKADSCKYFFYNAFELYFENDSLLKSYGYFQDCDGGKEYDQIGDISSEYSFCGRYAQPDKMDHLIKQEDITAHMREILGNQELKNIYEYFDETFDNLFPKKYRARYKLNRMNR